MSNFENAVLNYADQKFSEFLGQFIDDACDHHSYPTRELRIIARYDGFLITFFEILAEHLSRWGWPPEELKDAAYRAAQRRGEGSAYARGVIPLGNGDDDPDCNALADEAETLLTNDKSSTE